MPCRSDYMEPNEQEIEYSKVLCLLLELQDGTLPKNYGDGYHGAYNNTTQEQLDHATNLLCSKLQRLHETEIKEKSLEMQIWWMDHQELDRKRIQEELNAEKKRVAKEEAISKLTDYERKLLGI